MRHDYVLVWSEELGIGWTYDRHYSFLRVIWESKVAAELLQRLMPAETLNTAAYRPGSWADYLPAYKFKTYWLKHPEGKSW